jgi:hypothetical protein
MSAWQTLDEAAPDVPAREATRRAGRGIVDLLMIMGVITLFTLSNYALEYFGIPYTSEGGSLFSKIHPASYLFCMALVLAVVANRNPIVYTLDLLLRYWGSTFLLAACLLLWLFISRYKPGYTASFLIDALICAGVITLVFADAGERARLAAARAVHVIMVINCLLSIVEGNTGWRLFPFVMGGVDQTWEYRATALLGHPLTGGLVTGVYAVILMTVRDVRGLSERWRWPIALLCMAAMPFIGSRTSFVIVYATAACVAVPGLVRFLNGEPVSARKVLAIMIVVPFAVGVLLALFQMGLFDNFINRFLNDQSSAESRVQLFDLFKGFGLRDLLIGESFADLQTNIRLNSVAPSIENSWAALLLNYGLVMSAVLWVGIAGWFADMLRVAGRNAILPLVYVFLVISTTVGISNKTGMLTLPAVLILALTAGAQASDPPRHPTRPV